MSHSYGNGNQNENNYLNKKRMEDDIPMNNRYHYDKYDKFDKFGNHGRYNNMNYMHSKPPPTNNYYNSNCRYRGNYYSNPKPFHGNVYSNKIGPKREYKKSYQKYSNANMNEGIRNLSHCEMPSPPPLSLKPKQDGDSLKSISSKNIGESKSNSIRTLNTNNSINIKDINKFVSNITTIPGGRGQPIFNQQSINIDIKLPSPSNLKFKEDSKKWRKDEEEDNEEIPIFNFPKPPEKLLNYQSFDKSSIKIEENPLENFEIYPKKLYELKINNFSRKLKNDEIRNENIENVLSIKSCYLLAKIPNWRLVTNFIPGSRLTKEKFKNIIPLEEEDDDKNEELSKSKSNIETEEKKDKEKGKKFYLVYNEKYEEIVNKYLEQTTQKKKQAKRDIFNKRFIIAQYHYDILKLKNKIKQNKYKLNYLNINQECLKNALEGNNN